MKNTILKPLLVVFLFPSHFFSMAQEVTSQNGNLYVSFSDVYFRSSSLRIERIYNSKTAFSGIFGHSWCNEYLDFLVILPGKSILHSAYGGGMEQFFHHSTIDKADLKARVEQMIKVAQETGKVKTPEELKELKEKLLNNQNDRVQYWVELLQNMLV